MNDKQKEQIKKTIKENRIKRHSQRCKTFCLKIDESRLNKVEKEQLKMFFIEAKWLYNDILANNDPFNYNYKNTIVTILDKDKNPIQKTLHFLPVRIRYDLIKGFRQNIINLSKNKKCGNKIGKLKFKSNIDSISLYRHTHTHYISGYNRLKIIGIKRHLVVRGLKQIESHYEIANAKLLKKATGYYIMLTCYEFIKPEMLVKKGEDIGLDFGIKSNIVTSNGEVFKVSIGESGRLKRLQKRLSRQKNNCKKKRIKCSNNAYKTKLLIKKEYEKLTNKKHDTANKIVNSLLTQYDVIYMQDEQLAKWHKDFGKEVQHSCIGTIKAKLFRSPNVRVIDKWYPSTKLCYQCGKINEIPLSQRIYKCECGLEEDRDIKAAKTIMHAGKCQNSYVPCRIKVPMESREFKLVENDAASAKTSVLVPSIVQ